MDMKWVSPQHSQWKLPAVAKRREPQYPNPFERPAL
jgi:hypothetical protein